jgi:hypothetical protein
MFTGMQYVSKPVHRSSVFIDMFQCPRKFSMYRHVLKFTGIQYVSIRSYVHENSIVIDTFLSSQEFNIYRHVLILYLVLVCFTFARLALLAPVHPIGSRHVEGPADFICTAKCKVTPGGSLTEAREARFRHSLTCWSRFCLG